MKIEFHELDREDDFSFIIFLFRFGYFLTFASLDNYLTGSAVDWKIHGVRVVTTILFVYC